MIDTVADFCREYHVVAIGIGLMVLGFVLTHLLKTPAGDWKWKKCKRK